MRWYFFRRAEIGMTASGPSVWTGRALQAENDDLEMIGLALLYPAPKERLCSWPSWIIRARSISFATRPRRPEGPPDHERAGETFSPFLLVPTRRPRRESQLLLSGQTGHQTAHRISGTRLVSVAKRISPFKTCVIARFFAHVFLAPYMCIVSHS